MALATPHEQPRPASPMSIEDALERYGPEIYRHLRRMSPTAEDAADLHQETFVRALAAHGRLSDGANVRAWLYRIAGNLARDQHRRRLVRVAVHGPDAPVSQSTAEHEGPAPGPVDRHPGPQATALAAELRDHVRAALLELGRRQRVAVIERVFEGRDYAEIAQLLDCTEPTARQHVSQGLRRLRARLASYVEIPA